MTLCVCVTFDLDFIQWAPFIHGRYISLRGSEHPIGCKFSSLDFKISVVAPIENDLGHVISRSRQFP